MRPALIAKLLPLVAGCVLAVAAESVAFAQPAKPDDPPPGAAACTGCHAANPVVASPGPSLSGRAPKEMQTALDEFRSGKRPAMVMDRIVRGYSPDELQAIVAWFAAQK